MSKLYKKAISKSFEYYERQKSYESWKAFLKTLNSKPNLIAKIKFCNPSLPIMQIVNDSILGIVSMLWLIIAIPIYIIWSSYFFPYLIFWNMKEKYLRKEILKLVLEKENEEKIKEFLKLCNKDFSNVDYIGSGKKEKIRQDLFWYNEEVIRAHGVENFKIIEDFND